MTAGLMNAAGAIGAITAPSSARRGRDLDRADAADLLAARLVEDHARRVEEALGVVLADRLSKALHGAAGDHVGGAGEAGRQLEGADRELGGAELLAVALARGVCGKGDAHVGRERLEAADLNDLDAGRLGLGVDVAGGAGDEGHLAGEVDVVRAAGDAGVDHGAPVGGVRPDEVEDDLGALGHRKQRRGVGHVRRDRRRALHANVGKR